MADKLATVKACTECYEEVARKGGPTARVDCRFCVSDYRLALIEEREAREKAEASLAAYRDALGAAMGHICRACLAPLSMGCPRYPEQTDCGGSAGPIVALLRAPDPARDVIERLAAGKAVRVAAEGLLKEIQGLADSGDSGYWNPEDQKPVKKARAAFALYDKAVGRDG